jgi:hypothetical protein
MKMILILKINIPYLLKTSREKIKKIPRGSPSMREPAWHGEVTEKKRLF